MLFHISLFRIIMGGGILTGTDSSSLEEAAEVLSSEEPVVLDFLVKRFFVSGLFGTVGKRVLRFRAIVLKGTDTSASIESAAG